MAIVFEEYSKNVAKKGLYVPLELQQAASAEHDALENAGIPKKRLKGLKTFASLDSSYNKNEKNPNSKNNPKQTTNYITADVADKAIDRWGKTNSILPKTKIAPQIKSFLDTVKSKASRQDKVSPVAPPKPTADPAQKPEVDKAKEISMPNGKIKLAASVEPRKVMDEAKKIYITEEQVLKIRDYGKKSD